MRALPWSRLATIAVALTVASALPAAAQQRVQTSSSVVDLAGIHIDNFGEVDPTFYRGAQPKGRDYDDLKALGVKALINLTSEDADPNEKALAERAGMRYFDIPMTTHDAPTADQLSKFLAIVADPANLPVYVHCVGGRHRTGVMTAAYRITHDKWTADQAFAEMKRYKFGADFLHPEFKEFVYRYRADASARGPAIAASTKSGG